MNWCSLDPNTRHTGVVLWHDETPTLAYTLHAPNGSMTNDLLELIYTAEPEAVAVEDTYVGENMQTSIKLARLVGAIGGFCEWRGVPVYVLSTAEIDKATGIRMFRKESNLRLASRVRLRGRNWAGVPRARRSPVADAGRSAGLY